MFCAKFSVALPAAGAGPHPLHPRQQLRNIDVHSTALSRVASDHLPIKAEVVKG